MDLPDLPGVVIVVVLAGTLPLCCAKPPARPVDPRPVVTVPAPTVPTASAAPAVSADADAAPVAVASSSGSPTPRSTSDPNTFSCRDKNCRVGEETCCALHDEGSCQPSVNDGPIGSIGYLKTQWEACDKLQWSNKRTGFNRMARCDESIDCKNGGICCANFLFSGSDGLSECTPPHKKKGFSPCDMGELCIAGSPCRLPGTVCDGIFCVKPVPNLRCPDAPCASDKVCCGSTQDCRSPSECDERFRIKCRHNSDCIPGALCVLWDTASWCAGYVTEDGTGAPSLCERDSDCTRRCPSSGGVRQRCGASRIPWLKRCECP